jgi:hypothetical protein
MRDGGVTGPGSPSSRERGQEVSYNDVEPHADGGRIP